MKIAYIMSRFPKLTETFVLNEMRAMEALGVDVEVYPLLRERQHVAHPEAVEWARRARYHPFLSWSILQAQAYFLWKRPKDYFRLWKEVLSETWGSRNFFIGAIGIFPKAVRFAYEMRERRVEHVHAHFATHPAVAALIVNRLTGIPFSFTAHGSDLHVERRMLGTKVAAAAFAVTVSEYNRELMVRECGAETRNKIHVVHCGIDPDAFKASSPPVSSRNLFRLICVASFEEVKGHRFLIEACRVLRERGIVFQCDLVGEGPLRREVEARAARLGLRDRIRIHGGRPRPEVIRLLSSSHVAVLASHPTREGKREGIPVALMEAMACGLPVVSTSISGIPELVDSGKNGFLVPPKNSVALANALHRLAKDEQLRQSMGQAAREKVLREFDLHSSARRLLDLFLAERASSRIAISLARPPARV